MDEYVEVKYTVYLNVPKDMVEDIEGVATYLNDKLYTDPEFFGNIEAEQLEVQSYVDGETVVELNVPADEVNDKLTTAIQALSQDDTSVTLKDVAEYMNVPLKQVIDRAEELFEQGYILYNFDKID